jgi:hypothetical protein
MAKTRASTLTREELALVADGLVESLTDDGARRLGHVIRTDPRFTAEFVELEAVAREAGLEPGGSFEYLSAAQAIDEALTMLLDTRGWGHPAEILDPDGSRGIPYPMLIRLARKREGKSEDAERILQVRQRLEEAFAAEKAEDALVERFVAVLLELPPERATHLFARAAQQYNRQAGEAASPDAHHREQAQ